MAESFTGRVEIGGEQEKEGADRRRAQRFERQFVLNYSIVALPDAKTLMDTLDKLLTAQSTDLSEVGIAMWTNKLLMPGSTIEMEFPSPPGNLSVKVKARVVWCQPHTEGGYVRARAGLEFVDVDPVTRTKLVEVIRSSTEESGGAAPAA